MTACAIDLRDKQKLGRRVGRDLQRRHGRKAWYSPEDIRSSMRRLDYPFMWDCWALSLYSSPIDFDAFHRARNETCDYQGMHAEMASCLTGDGSFWSGLLDFFSFDWVDWHLPSWLDFDFFDHHH
jgi:hypothetical protein